MSRRFAAVALACVVASPLWAGVKEDQYQQMIGIAQQMRDLRASGSSSSAQYAALASQYAQLSAAMGGDDPGRTIPDGSPAVDGRSPSAPEGGVGVIPPPPAGCAVTATATNNNTPVAIPTGPGVVTSTLVVSGAGAYIWDVNLETFITHTFTADLDITLQSPAGTIVTLTTDNGGSNDNVFNGTVWDDQANPGGQVPYTTNNGLVTDHAYVNLTLASPLVPEEAMGAFIGEDPNGTWTITISDDLAGDGGSLGSWTLEVATLPAAPTPTTNGFGNNTPVAIPTGPGVVSSTLVVAGAGATLTDLNLTTFITHTFAADLEITLQSPAGTIVTLTTDNGGSNDNVFNGTVWDDDANPGGQVPYTTNNGLVTDHAYVDLTLASPLVPEEAMAAFIGEDPNGTWTITISDDLAGDGGSLNSWSLDIQTGTCVQPCVLTCPANVTTGNDAGQCGAVVNYAAPGTSGDCGVIVCAPASGSFFAVGTTPILCLEQPVGAPTGTGASCTFDVTVNDTEPPALTCPADVFAAAPPGALSWPVDFTTPTPTDNCPGVTAACDPASGSTFPVGTTTDVCSATDATGNTSACGFDVTVGTEAIQDIPTASTLGLAALALLLAGAAFVALRRHG